MAMAHLALEQCDTAAMTSAHTAHLYSRGHEVESACDGDVISKRHLAASGRPLLVQWEQFLDIRSNVTFVQVGAHNGAGHHDMLRPFATRCTSWRGLLVEPTTNSFRQLCANYASYRDRFMPVRAAVSDTPGMGRLQIMKNGCTPGECNHLLYPGDNIRWHQSWARTTESERVQMVTLRQLWRHALPTLLQPAPVAVDLLVVDVEGSEPHVFQHDLPSPKPRLVAFEHKHLYDRRLAPEDQPAAIINRTLHRQGYRCLGRIGNKGEDYLYQLAAPPARAR